MAVGGVLQVGYYFPQDGLGCIWLWDPRRVASSRQHKGRLSEPRYQETADQAYVDRYFEILRPGTTLDYFGEYRAREQNMARAVEAELASRRILPAPEMADLRAIGPFRDPVFERDFDLPEGRGSPLRSLVRAIRLGRHPGAALAALDSLVRRGDLKAAFAAGLCYRSALAMKPSPKRAAHLFRKAAGNLPEAKCALAESHLFGIGVKRNPTMAYGLLKSLVDTGLPRVDYRLAECLHYGWGTRQDLGAALDFYIRSARAGFPFALTRLGQFHQCGYLLQRNSRIARQLYSMALAKGDMDAAYRMGLMYLYADGVACDYDKAFLLLEHSANAGNYMAHYELGEMLLIGLGRCKNRPMGQKHLKKAHDIQSHVRGWHRLMRHDDQIADEITECLVRRAV
jgi:TPR repeat protein